MTATAAGAPAGTAPPPAGRDRSLARATVTITFWNAVSRVTGFARVIATGAALGATALGDTYQAANLVSNILFELLAGGMLSSVLVPVFVERLERGDRAGAARLAGALQAKAAVFLGLLVLVGMIAATWVMRALTVGVSDAAVRDQQVHLGAFLLLFFLPQVVLYATGAVASALLYADHRFAAASVAPVFNNVVVIATMVVFRSMRHGSTSFGMSSSQKLVLAIGTTAGVLVMTLVPIVATWWGGLRVRPRWRAGEPLRDIASRGMWAVGHLGLNQVLVAVTIVLAAQVAGGVIAYQIAFTFFLLPHAVLSNPIFTALYPRLSADAQAGRLDAFASDLGAGLRFTAFLLLPATVLLAALARPLLDAVRLGALDKAGAGLVAAVLAAYAAGLLGYSTFFLLTRASYALDDVKGPTLVNLVVTSGAIVVMVLVSALARGDGRVIVLGLVHAVAVSAGAVALLARVRARCGRSIEVGRATVRDIFASLLAGAAAWLVVHVVRAAAGAPAARATAMVALAVAGLAGAVVYLAVQLAAGAPELKSPLATMRRGGA
jgi:putative peptidoglycan lipid II flippase